MINRAHNGPKALAAAAAQTAAPMTTAAITRSSVAIARVGCRSPGRARLDHPGHSGESAVQRVDSTVYFANWMPLQRAASALLPWRKL